MCFIWGYVSVWVASTSYNWSRKWRKKNTHTHFSASDFQVRPVLPTPQCFQAYQIQNKTHFYGIISFYLSQVEKSALLRVLLWALQVHICTRSFCRTKWWCLYWAGAGEPSRRKKQVSIPHLLPPGDMACVWPRHAQSLGQAGKSEVFFT